MDRVVREHRIEGSIPKRERIVHVGDMKIAAGRFALPSGGDGPRIDIDARDAGVQLAGEEGRDPTRPTRNVQDRCHAGTESRGELARLRGLDPSELAEILVVRLKADTALRICVDGGIGLLVEIRSLGHTRTLSHPSISLVEEPLSGPKERGPGPRNRRFGAYPRRRTAPHAIWSSTALTCSMVVSGFTKQSRAIFSPIHVVGWTNPIWASSVRRHQDS